MEVYSNIVVHWTSEEGLINIIEDNKISCPCSLTDYRWFGERNSNIPSDDFLGTKIEVMYEDETIFENDENEDESDVEKLNENEFNSLLSSGVYGLRWQYGLIFHKKDLELTSFKDLVEKSKGKIHTVYAYEYEREYNSNKDISLDLCVGIMYTGDISENILPLIKRKFEVVLNEKNTSNIFKTEEIII